MSKKYEKFKADLVALCVKHDVHLSDCDEGVEVHDGAMLAGDRRPDPLHYLTMHDETEDR